MGKWTHFCIDPDNRTRKTLFVLGKCETCDGDIQEPNAVGSTSSRNKLYSVGLREYYDPLPPEIYYDDDTDKSVCENCLNQEYCF